MKLLIAAMAMVLVSGCAGQIWTGDPAASKGGILIDRAGMTLYTFDKDPAGKSACYGACAKNWPPVSASLFDQARAPWQIVLRDDGMHQWALKGKPLYYWAKDKKPGDKTGDGVGGVWHAAKP